MNRFILTYQGYGEAPDELVSRVKDDLKVRVVDRFGDNVIVEGTPKDLRNLVSGLRGWFSSPERRIGQPRMYKSGSGSF